MNSGSQKEETLALATVRTNCRHQERRCATQKAKIEAKDEIFVVERREAKEERNMEKM